LIPLAKEVFSSYGNVPMPINQLKQEFQEKVIEGFGFKSIDYSLLNDDNLYFLRDMEVEPTLKQHYLERCEPMKDGDLVPIFKQIFQDRADQGYEGEERLCIEPNEELYLRVVKLREQMLKAVDETQQRTGAPLSGKNKILLVCHSRTMRAFSSTGVDQERPKEFVGSFYSKNTEITPYKVAVAQDGSRTFEHSRA